MGIIFVLHLAIFVAYILLKLWDLIIKKSFSFVYWVFVFIEFSLMIVGFLFFLPYCIFSIFTNFKYSVFEHTYFNFSFVISIFYLVIFILCWIYFFIRLLGSAEFFTNPIIYNWYYYFFCAMKNKKSSKTYDLINAIYIAGIAICIALLTEEYLSQIIIIFILILIILLYLICQRPYKY